MIIHIGKYKFIIIMTITFLIGMIVGYGFGWGSCFNTAVSLAQKLLDIQLNADALKELTDKFPYMLTYFK